jgi:hypothetical protein
LTKSESKPNIYKTEQVRKRGSSFGSVFNKSLGKIYYSRTSQLSTKFLNLRLSVFHYSAFKSLGALLGVAHGRVAGTTRGQKIHSNGGESIRQLTDGRGGFNSGKLFLLGTHPHCQWR